jgi:hypothetical protein
MGPRAAFSQVLIAGGFVLLVAIGVGTAMGNHVLGQVAGQEPIAPTPVPIPTPTGGDSANSSAWKHLTILSVATDPAFPDPRITPEQEPTPRPRRTATPRPSPTPSPPSGAPYTSPPLPIPLSSDGETAEPRPTLPPVVGPSLSP